LLGCERSSVFDQTLGEREVVFHLVRSGEDGLFQGGRPFPAATEQAERAASATERGRAFGAIRKDAISKGEGLAASCADGLLFGAAALKGLRLLG
jgi:hypothetical protein